MNSRLLKALSACADVQRAWPLRLAEAESVLTSRAFTRRAVCSPARQPLVHPLSPQVGAHGKLNVFLTWLCGSRLHNGVSITTTQETSYGHLTLHASPPAAQADGGRPRHHADPRLRPAAPAARAVAGPPRRRAPVDVHPPHAALPAAAAAARRAALSHGPGGGRARHQSRTRRPPTASSSMSSATRAASRRPDFQRAVAAAMKGDLNNPDPAKVPRFFYHLGDVVYFNGQPSEYYGQFYEPYDHYTPPILAIPGNHDGDPIDDTQTSLDGWVEYFMTPTPHVDPISQDAPQVTLSLPNVYLDAERPVRHHRRDVHQRPGGRLHRLGAAAVADQRAGDRAGGQGADRRPAPPDLLVRRPPQRQPAHGGRLAARHQRLAAGAEPGADGPRPQLPAHRAADRGRRRADARSSWRAWAATPTCTA